MNEDILLTEIDDILFNNIYQIKNIRDDDIKNLSFSDSKKAYIKEELDKAIDSLHNTRITLGRVKAND